MLLPLLRSGWIINFFLYHLNYEFLKCLESTCLVMDATTNSTLLLSLKALYKADIQNITKLVNIKAEKRNKKLLLQKITDQPTGQQTCSSSPTLQWQVLYVHHWLLSISCAAVSNLIHTHRWWGRSQNHRNSSQADQGYLWTQSISYFESLEPTFCFDKLLAWLSS